MQMRVEQQILSLGVQHRRETELRAQAPCVGREPQKGCGGGLRACLPIGLTPSSECRNVAPERAIDESASPPSPLAGRAGEGANSPKLTAIGAGTASTVNGPVTRADGRWLAANARPLAHG
jgi:hypothetical protein